jgi:hypothetical protein
MMHKYRSVIWLSLFLLTVCLSGCELNEVVEEGELSHWFLSRLGWAALISASLGVVAARLLCNLPIRAPFMDCIKAARIRFLKWLICLVLLFTPLLLWFDALMTQPFGEGSELSWAKVIYLVTLDLRTLGLMACVAIVFYLSVAISTRSIFGRTCNCRYAFFP